MKGMEAEFLTDAGIIRRARGWRLYTGDGRRLIDLWQDGGRALLGHTQNAVLRELKNHSERGLFAPFPSYAGAHFYKALRALFPNASGFSILNCALFDVKAVLGYPLWRPFSMEDEAALHEPVFVPVLPFPLAPVVAVYTGGAKPEPANAACSPVLLAAATRAVYNLIAAGARGAVQFGKVNSALKKAEERGTSLWRRDGIYLRYKESADACVSADMPAADTGITPRYLMLCRAFLAGGFLPPPSPFYPFILPGEMSAGEEAKLVKLLEASCLIKN
ncbi:MAG: hypothetical protein LBG72_02990 [Spirochaetaceae bacterium]|jgi:hypothetical protein|nr:hypothetical protein [Spirochaetaceae bacterium]